MLVGFFPGDYTNKMSVMISPTEPYLLMKQIRDEIFALPKSPLVAYRQANNFFPVIGEGSHQAKLMLVGEAPGRNEAKTGRPFCGRAGQLLDELLSAIGVNRADVYITNIVKDRPPANRDPLPEEIACYGPFLDRQIAIIKPEVIVSLGRFSMTYLLNRCELVDQLGTIGALHGRVFTGKIFDRPVKLVPMYHPAAAIYNNSLRDVLLKDFQLLRHLL